MVTSNFFIVERVRIRNRSYNPIESAHLEYIIRLIKNQSRLATGLESDWNLPKQPNKLISTYQEDSCTAQRLKYITLR